jgi:TetR/AcrR family transcriptional repressor of nem operon
MRYKEYNVNKVLEKSIKLFWENGFRGCSINKIVNITGVNRFSLYHEFENKEGILYASLHLYRGRYCQEKLDYLKKEGSLPDILKEFYLSFIDENNAIPGC